MRNLALTSTLALALLASGACSGSAPEEKASEGAQVSSGGALTPAQMRGEVLETMDSGGYTYVRIGATGQELWAAGPVTQVEVGDTVQLSGAMPMTNFHSKTLNRTFEVLYFVNAIQDADASQNPAVAAAHSGMGMEAPAAESDLDLEGIEKAGQTVAELYDQRSRLVGEEVSVRGRVVKFNSSILGRNWVHLQDGTGEGGSRDITVTTDEVAEVGDLVVATGKLVENQDFGFGYEYDLLIEEAAIRQE